MKRKKPSFNETYYGFRTFSHLLEDAQRRGIVVLRRDQKSGSYIVEDLGASGIGTQAPGPVAVASSRPAETRAAEPRAAEPAPAAAEAAADGTNGARTPRRRRSRSRRPRSGSLLAPGEAPVDAGSSDEAADGEPETDASYADDAEGGAPASEPAADRPDGGYAAAADEKPAAQPDHEDTSPFSFFSWMRRENDPKK
jgi:hypothetical protein